MLEGSALVALAVLVCHQAMRWLAQHPLVEHRQCRSPLQLQESQRPVLGLETADPRDLEDTIVQSCRTVQRTRSNEGSTLPLQLSQSRVSSCPRRTPSSS